MGRYLARALAALRIEPTAAVPPTVSRTAAAGGFGGFGGFGDAAENENQPLPQSAWPAGVDVHLTRDAARVSGLVSGGADWRWCQDGGLEILKEDGLLWALSPTYSRRLQAEQLLPPALLENAP